MKCCVMKCQKILHMNCFLLLVNINCKSIKLIHTKLQQLDNLYIYLMFFQNIYSQEISLNFGFAVKDFSHNQKFSFLIVFPTRICQKHIVFRACLRCLLFAGPTYNALFEFLLAFSHYKKFKFACCLGVSSQNCPNYTEIWSFYSYCSHALSF